jgi:peptidyl-prolyl cis-trans isomerase SurA
MPMRPKLFSFFAIAAVMLAGGMRPPASQGQELLSGIAAVVNNDVITFNDLRELVGPKEKAARDTLTGQALVEKVKEIRLAALNDLINRQLILQEFKELQKKNGANIPPHIIDEHVETIVREQFGGDRSAFVRTLSAQGLTLERFRQMEEERIIVQAMRGQHLKESAIIPEADIRKYYDQHLADYTSADEMKLRMLVMKKSASGDDNRKKMMQEIRQKIVGGAAFSDLARMYDEDDSHQESGGDWGWINRGVLSESLSKAAFSLKAGEISPIIELGGNYYLLYCEAKKPGISKSFTEVRGEIEKTLAQQDRQKGQDAWLAKLRKKAYVKIF